MKLVYEIGSGLYSAQVLYLWAWDSVCNKINSEYTQYVPLQMFLLIKKVS